jgi:hypothetical protein
VKFRITIDLPNSYFPLEGLLIQRFRDTNSKMDAGTKASHDCH